MIFSYFVALVALFFAAVWAAETLLLAFVVAVVTGLVAVEVAVEVAEETACPGAAAALSATEPTRDSEVCTPLSTAQFIVSPKPSTVFCALPFSRSLNDENTPDFGACWLGAGAAVEDA